MTLEQYIYQQLQERFPELWDDEPLNGGDAVDRLVGWKEELARYGAVEDDR